MDIVIGAGATGLTYACFTKNDYLILEADQQAGGYCKTIKQDGFVWDYAGHFFHFQHPELELYLREYINPDHILVCQKHSQINYNGWYVDFPFQKNIHQLKKEELIDCIYDLFFNPYTSCTNFKEMLYQKFGVSIAEKFLIPYNEKLYACDLNSLDIDAMGRFFPYAEKEEIIANFKNSNSKSYNDFFTYPKNGAIEYINSLLHRIPVEKVSLGERVISINRPKKTITTNQRILSYDRLISTIPFPQLLELSQLPFEKDKYSWNQVLVFNLGFESKGNDTQNNWVYFSDKNIHFYRVGYYDNIFNDNKMSLYVELGFKKNEPIDIEKTFVQVMNDLKKTKVITTQQLISRHEVIMNPAYVHITNESIQDVEEKQSILANDSIYSIGRYGNWTYCSIEDGMLMAKSLAKQLNYCSS